MAAPVLEPKISFLQPEGVQTYSQADIDEMSHFE